MPWHGLFDVEHRCCLGLWSIFCVGFFFYLEIGICCFFGYQEFGLLGGMKPIRCLDISLDVKGYP